jgi:hypothetical protein
MEIKDLNYEKKVGIFFHQLKDSVIKILILLKLMYRFNAKPIKNLLQVFMWVCVLTSQF